MNNHTAPPQPRVLAAYMDHPIRIHKAAALFIAGWGLLKMTESAFRGDQALNLEFNIRLSWLGGYQHLLCYLQNDV